MSHVKRTFDLRWVCRSVLCGALLHSVFDDVNAFTSSAQTPALAEHAPRSGRVLVFEAATVKPADPKSTGWRMEFSADGFLASNVSLRLLTKDAFDAYEPGRLTGGPAWMDKDNFDVKAKLDTEELPQFADLSLEERRVMLQKLLQDRFKLVVHHESHTLSLLALGVAKGGPKLQRTDESSAFRGSVKGINCLITRSKRGELTGTHCAAKDISRVLQGSTGHMVQDDTGLTGFYDFDLHWTPDQPVRTEANSGVGATADEDAWPSLYAAVRQQLGLELKPTHGSVDVVVVDSAERPPEN